jgi:CHASE2 domain-containing sensor protein
MPDPRRKGRWYQRGIRTLQILSIVMMWAFLGGIVTWVLNMVRVSHSLGDALNASVGISLVAIPVYSLVAGILTYVYFGIQRGRKGPGE